MARGPVSRVPAHRNNPGEVTGRVHFRASNILNWIIRKVIINSETKMGEGRINAAVELYNANTLLFQRVSELLQHSNQQWVRESRKAIADSGRESEAQLRELLDARDFPALITLQTNIVRQHWQRHENTIQDALRRSAVDPDVLLSGLTDAFREWQQSVESAAAHLANRPVNGPWMEYLNLTTRFWTQGDNKPTNLA